MKIENAKQERCVPAHPSMRMQDGTGVYSHNIDMK